MRRDKRASVDGGVVWCYGAFCNGVMMGFFSISDFLGRLGGKRVALS